MNCAAKQRRGTFIYSASCAVFVLIALTVILISNEYQLVAAERQHQVKQQALATTETPPGTLSGGLTGYLTTARNLFATGIEASDAASAYSNLRPNNDPRTDRLLRETIDKTSDLIKDYQHEGLNNMPALPNLPGLNTLMRLPDKLLRAELVMLQHGIRMAQEMRERPISATVNTPRELANMFMRMTAQLNQ